MTSLWDLTRLIFAALPQVLLSGWAALLLLVAMGLVYYQYRRVEKTEAELHGLSKHHALEQTVYSLVFGVVAGVMGSLLLSALGVGLVEAPGRVSALLYLWPVSFLLGLINPRYLCFAYGATFLSVSHLAFGWPQVDVPTVIGLVAVLHMVEALLIVLSGASCASPVSVQKAAGVVPGFTVQRFWPVPLVLPLFAPGLELAAAMPDWWPLLKSDPLWLGQVDSMGWQLIPVVVTMGFSTLAIAAPPEVRARQSARDLLIYSGMLLALALAASHYRPILWAAALFSGLGHEAMALWAGRSQLRGAPFLQRPPRGVGLLDVLPGTTAAAANFRAGTVILAVDNYEVNSREELHEALLASPAFVRVMFRNGREVEHVRLPRPSDGLLGLGAILLPEPGDAAVVRPQRSRLFRWTGSDG